MDTRQSVSLHTGRTVPPVGLGTWQMKGDVPGTVADAIKLGYRLIDTSRDYGTQPAVGEGIKQSGVPRDELFIAAKVEEDEDAYEATRHNVKEELQLEHVNLMLIHRPPKDGAGVELWRGLMKARDEGLTIDIGVSNYSEEDIQALIDATGETPVVNQIEWSPFGWSKAMYEFCRSKKILIQAYSPITRGKRLEHKALQELANKYNKAPAQIILRWDIQKGVVPLPKANRLEHLKENIDVFDFGLTAEDMSQLDELNEAFSSLGPKPAYQA